MAMDLDLSGLTVIPFLIKFINIIIKVAFLFLAQPHE